VQRKQRRRERVGEVLAVVEASDGSQWSNYYKIGTGSERERMRVGSERSKMGYIKKKLIAFLFPLTEHISSTFFLCLSYQN